MAKTITLSVPAEAAYARSVRMLAATLAVTCDMSVDDVEDVRMVAEEGFVYACATRPEPCDISFTLEEGSISMRFSLGEAEPEDGSIELVEVLLDAICDEFYETEDASSLCLVKRCGGGADGH